ncbi:riboflavin-aldehyde forming enzyme [Stereum hirsutum FP-91666 SS1]|uniref:riboflavin-aldehyde forming enzyme n=1 Tax=Stereum hirsutum (strain FP-91666) TaxID=721885 RepID=UPI0004449736|nr:riboflavin-aldehyde forming enzyme [Stereum hirsutum FP-91666 SS1]EIM85072.1 riboflavin-aldehyde forming enzyme [Stereum hirsutum FP-91666 SS1]
MVAASPLETRSKSGRGTFFAVGLGACGNTNSDSDHIVALATADYDNGAHCGKKISITANGKTSTATVEDECPGCSSGDLDMSPSLFDKFANEDVGVVKVTWKYT